MTVYKNQGFLFPLKRLTVNLAPADLPKQGPAYDLPIAVGILLASGQLSPLSSHRGTLFSWRVREYCRLRNAGRSLLRSAMQQLQMSASPFRRILKLARTIADLAGDKEIITAHLAEAIQYRPRSRCEEG